MNKFKISGLILLVIYIITTIASVMFWSKSQYNPLIFSILLSTIGFLLALFILVLVFFVYTIINKNAFSHNPDPVYDGSFRFLVKVDKNRQVTIEREGNAIRVIEGGKSPQENRDISNDPKFKDIIRQARSPVAPNLLYNMFSTFDDLYYETTGLYFYLPYFTKPKVLPLPRAIKESSGKYRPLLESEPGFYTNHVRNTITTWYFVYSGIDIQGLEFKVTGSLQYRINKDKVLQVLYKTDAWNVLLDQVTFSIIRDTMKHSATIDKVVGRVSQNIWDEGEVPTLGFRELSNTILAQIQEHKLDKTKGATPETLGSVGIDVVDVLINDFEPLFKNEEQKQQFLKPIFERQKARGIELTSTAHANAQEKIRDVHNKGGEASRDIIQADAFVRAVEGNKLVEALIASLIQNRTKK